MNTSLIIESQLLATKFFLPRAPRALISRSRLSLLLAESLKRPFTLVSAPAGFGKTISLSTWAQSLPARHPWVAWVSLDEEDNDPRLFWTYLLSALDQQLEEPFTSLLKYLQSPDPPPLMQVLAPLLNLMQDRQEQVVLILDDYHLITEPQVHTTLWYLIEHLPVQWHLIVATRIDPPFSLSRLRTRGHLLEVRTEHLRCTVKETRAFFKQVMHTHLPEEMIQQITARTEGWLAGLHLFALSLQGEVHPVRLLEEISGDQSYVLDYLTQEILFHQSPQMQAFLLSTCILRQLTASLCDAVMQQTGSQQLLERLEQANVFVVPLDTRRQWYRYHRLFAQALYYQLEQTQPHLVPLLHSRASLWYAEHEQMTEAILHALRAKAWQRAADLIEQRHLPTIALTWGMHEHELVLLREWLELLPADIVRSRPRLCLACALLVWTVAPNSVLDSWLDAAETTLMASFTQRTQMATSPSSLSPEKRQEQENLLGEVIGFRAFLHSYEEDGHIALALVQRCLALLSPDNFVARAQVTIIEMTVLSASSLNNAVAALKSGSQAIAFAQSTGLTSFVITTMGTVALYMLGAGQLREAQHGSWQAMLRGTQPGGDRLPEVGLPTVIQAEILREWNQLETALTLAEEGIKLQKQTLSMAQLPHLLSGYGILLHLHLSCGNLDAARSALQECERLGSSISRPTSLFTHSFLTIIDQIRLWLACGELERAIRWAEELDLKEQQTNPFVHEREEVARARIDLARKLPQLALQRLEPVLQRATAGQRWGHVIGIRLLQALAYQMCQQETQALQALSEALHLAEPQGYIRSFLDEGAPMQALLSKLRLEQCTYGPTPYLDTLLAAFARERQAKKRRLK